MNPTNPPAESVDVAVEPQSSGADAEPIAAAAWPVLIIVAPPLLVLDQLSIPNFHQSKQIQRIQERMTHSECHLSLHLKKGRGLNGYIKM